MAEPSKRHMIGYARISTGGQNLDLQVDALRAYGVPENRIYTDIMSGAKTDRPGFANALKAVRDGGALVVWKLDRLGRSLRGVLETLEGLHAKGVDLIVITESIDTRTAMGKFVFHILAALAQMERDMTIERTRAGLESARTRGVAIGRQDVMTPERIDQARQMLADDVAKERIAREIGVSKSRFYQWLRAEKARGEDEPEESI